MLKRKDFTLSTFLHMANPDLVKKYLLRFFRREELPPYLIGMNPNYVEHILDNTDDALKAVIIEDFRHINNVCHEDLPSWAAQRFGVPLYPKEKIQAVGAITGAITKRRLLVAYSILRLGRLVVFANLIW